MQRIKSFHLKASPTERGSKKDLSLIVDETVNSWINENPGVFNVRISQSVDTGASYPEAFIVLVYDIAEEAKPKQAVIESAPAVLPSIETPRRGRPPKN